MHPPLGAEACPFRPQLPVSQRLPTSGPQVSFVYLGMRQAVFTCRPQKVVGFKGLLCQLWANFFPKISLSAWGVQGTILGSFPDPSLCLAQTGGHRADFGHGLGPATIQALLVIGYLLFAGPIELGRSREEGKKSAPSLLSA